MNAINQTVKTRCRSIRDIAKYSINQIVIQQIHHRPGQQSTQFFTLVINRLVIATTEINPFKTAALTLYRIQDIHLFHIAISLHYQCITRSQFLNLLRINIKCRLNRRPFTGNHHNLIVDVIMRRPNPRWIANDKRIAMTQHTNHIVATVHVFKASLQNVRQR